MAMIRPIFSLIPSGYKEDKIYSILPNDGSGDFNFIRNSEATRINKNGILEVLDANVPKLDYSHSNCPVLLLEPQKENLFLNSDTLVTQDVTVLTDDYTVSFYGTGSITFSGAFSGTLNGLGYNERVSLSISASAGTLTCTVTGDVRNAQIELGYLTSYIPTGATSETRLREIAYTDTFALPNEGVFFAEIKAFTNTYASNEEIRLRNQNDDQRIVIRFSNVTNQITAYINDGAFKGVINHVTDITKFNKIAYSYTSSKQVLYVNGVEVGNVSDTINLTEQLDEVSTATGNFGSGNEANMIIKDLRIYENLTEPEILKLTSL